MQRWNKRTGIVRMECHQSKDTNRALWSNGRFYVILHRSRSMGLNRGATGDYLLIGNLRFVPKAPSFKEDLSHKFGLVRREE